MELVMRTQVTSRAHGAFAIAALSALALFGPPSIHVSTVAANTAGAPAGAVLLIEGKHHDEMGKLSMRARAETMQNGKRVTKPLSITRVSEGRYALARQWAMGTPWVLVITAEQENHGHGIAEALVKVDARGTILGIEHRKPDIVASNKQPARVVERDVLAALSSIPR
jgi:hypothetical protein